MATVHLVHGFLCCGKTTFAKAMERRTRDVRISLDEWLVALTGDPVRLEPELVERVHALTLQLWPEFVLRGIDVILDFGFWRRRHRDGVRRKAAGIGAAVTSTGSVAPTTLLASGAVNETPSVLARTTSATKGSMRCVRGSSRSTQTRSMS